MKIQFDSSQDYQLAAVQSVVNIFKGQPLSKGNFEVSLSMEGASIAFTERGIGNRLVLSDEQILQNIQKIQQENGLAISETLATAKYDKGEIPLNITVEMETGTGKTYTYLRTAYELNKVYGFKK